MIKPIGVVLEELQKENFGLENYNTEVLDGVIKSRFGIAVPKFGDTKITISNKESIDLDSYRNRPLDDKDIEYLYTFDNDILELI